MPTRIKVSRNRILWFRIFLFCLLLLLIPCISLDFLYASPSPASGFVSAGVKVGYDDGYLQFGQDLYVDSVVATVIDATNTVAGFTNNQLVFTLVNASADKYPSFNIVTGSTKPAYVLNVKNYSYITDRTLFYGLSDSKTVTMNFGEIGPGLKIIQTVTLTSPPTYDGNTLHFTISATGTSITKVYCPTLGKPTIIKVNGENYGSIPYIPYNEDTKILTLNIEHSSDAVLEVSWTSLPPTPTPTTGLIDQYLLMKDLLGFIQAIYTSIPGVGQWIYVLWLMILVVPIYMRTQSLTYISILFILFGAIVVAILPAGTFHIGWIFLVLGIGGILFKAFR